MRRLGVGLLLAGLLATFPAAPARAATAYPTIQDFKFTPSLIIVSQGSDVRWRNLGPSTHTVTSDTGLFDSGNIAGNNSTYQRTFSVAGSYAYHCKIHPNMKGTISVRQPGTPTPKPYSPTPSPSPTPKKSASPTPTASATPKKSVTPSPSPSLSQSPSPTPAATPKPSPSPTPTRTLIAQPPVSSGGDGGTRVWVAIALLVALGGGAVLVYQRFVHGA